MESPSPSSQADLQQALTVAHSEIRALRQAISAMRDQLEDARAGEQQRIQLATSLGSRLVGTLYVLDEPSIGLHSRDTARLIKILHDLRLAIRTPSADAPVAIGGSLKCDPYCLPTAMIEVAAGKSASLLQYEMGANVSHGSFASEPSRTEVLQCPLFRK